MRAINARGRQVKQRIAWAREHFGDHEELADWYAEGDEILAGLAAACHGEIDPRSLDEGPVPEWQAEGRRLVRVQRQAMANLGRFVRDSGLSPEEFAEAYARGEIQLPG
jgi:hypothetical protein